MKSLLARIFRSLARLVLVPVEILSNGIKSVVMMLMPRRPTDLEDAADDVLEEDDAPAPAAAPADLAARRARAPLPEADRVRLAARALMDGRPIPKAVLDPELGRDAQLLEWIRMLDEREVSMLGTVPAKRIEEHLNGGKRIAILALEGVVARKALAERRKAPAMTPEQWKAWLMQQGLKPEVTSAQAARFAAKGWNLEDLRRHAEERANRDAA